MKDLQALVNETSKKVAAKNRRKNTQYVSHLLAGASPGSSSRPMVDLEGEDRPEERVHEPAKRKRVETLTREPVTPIKVVPIRTEDGDLFQLPRVWFEPDRCGSHSTLFLDDPELKVIQDLATAGRSKAITEGVIAAMKALEIAAVLNNASMEGEVWAEVLAKEKDALFAKVSQLESDVVVARSVAKEHESHLAMLEKQVVDARTTLDQAVKASHKLAEEKKALEESLKREDLPGEDEMEDIAVLNRFGLVERISVLEGSFVDVVKLGFDRVVAQLKVVNPDTDLCVEGIHHLSLVEDGVIKSPLAMDEDIGMWIKSPVPLSHGRRHKHVD